MVFSKSANQLDLWQKFTIRMLFKAKSVNPKTYSPLLIIQFFFNHNVKDNDQKNLRQDFLAMVNADSDLKVLHYANELLVRFRLSFQKLLQTRSTCRNNKKKMFRKRVMMSTCCQ